MPWAVFLRSKDARAAAPSLYSHKKLLIMLQWRKRSRPWMKYQHATRLIETFDRLNTACSGTCHMLACMHGTLQNNHGSYHQR